MQFHIWLFFENLSRNVKCHENVTRVTGTLLEDRYTFLIISRSFLRRVWCFRQNLWIKSKDILCSVTFFFLNRTFYEIMWKNSVERSRPHCACALHAGCLTLLIRAHTICVILFAFPLQEWLHERALMLCYTYIICLVYIYFFFFNMVLLLAPLQQ